jgi:hypothetical protein
MGVLTVRADRGGVAMWKRVSILLLPAAWVLAGVAPLRAEETAAPAAAEEKGAESLSDLNKKLTNPVSSIWSLQFQNNNFRVDPGHGENGRWSTNLIFQPVMPVAINDDWNLITRPVLPLFVSQAHPEVGDPRDPDRSTAFGDITLLNLVSPSPELVGQWLLGVGPTWIFPTAPSEFTGQGKYQVGPAALVGYLSEKWILGALAQDWWSFGGKGGREETSGLNLQPIAAYFLPDGWSIGYSGNILANWESNRAGNVWTVPIGVQVAKVHKVGKLPIKFSLGLQWFPVQPEEYGQDWNVQIQITPVIPKLVKGHLADPSSLQFGMN